MFRETTAMHELTVKVTDGVDPPRHGYARVHILVEDENDHRPKWPADVLNVRVLEDTPSGTPIAQLVATDQDSGDNGVVDYTIVSGKPFSFAVVSIKIICKGSRVYRLPPD